MVTADPPNLRGFVPAEVAASLGNHRIEFVVIEIIHPWGWHIVAMKDDFFTDVVKFVERLLLIAG